MNIYTKEPKNIHKGALFTFQIYKMNLSQTQTLFGLFMSGGTILTLL